jgi:hypothetical protein
LCRYREDGSHDDVLCRVCFVARMQEMDIERERCFLEIREARKTQEQPVRKTKVHVRGYRIRDWEEL